MQLCLEPKYSSTITCWNIFLISAMTQKLAWQKRSRIPTKLFNRSGPLRRLTDMLWHFARALTTMRNFPGFLVWDIIDFFVEVIIPFVDVNFRGMPIFDILIYIFDIFYFKVWLSIKFSLMKSFCILLLTYYSVMLLRLLSIKGQQSIYFFLSL